MRKGGTGRERTPSLHPNQDGRRRWFSSRGQGVARVLSQVHPVKPQLLQHSQIRV